MHRFAFFTLLIATSMLAALPARAAEVIFLPGSRIGLAPPPGFEPTANGRGFEDRQNKSAILVLEMPPAAYAELEKAMTVEALKKQGLAVAFRETITIKGGKALLVAGRQIVDNVALRKWLLIGSTPNATAFVTALVPEDAKNAHPDSVLRAALSSLEVRPSVPVEEMLALLPFKLNELSGLRPFRIEGPTIYLTEGPNDTADYNEQPLLAVSAAPGGPTEPPQRDNFARNLLGGLPSLTGTRVISTDIIRLGGMQTHQLLAEAKDAKTGADIKLVQWVRFGNGAFVRFLGVARAEAWPDAFTRFRAVRDGLGNQ